MDNLYKYHANPRGGFFVQEYPFNPNGLGRLIGDILYYGKPSDCMWIADQLNKKLLEKDTVLDDNKILNILNKRNTMLKETGLLDIAMGTKSYYLPTVEKYADKLNNKLEELGLIKIIKYKNAEEYKILNNKTIGELRNFILENPETKKILDDYSKYTWKLHKKEMVNLFKEECPALRHLSTEGGDKLYSSYKIYNEDGLLKGRRKCSWEGLKDYVYNQPELNDLKNEINECKIKEQKNIKDLINEKQKMNTVMEL